MKKMEKIKRIFAILLIFLLNINTFATSLSDNDGSAFITKAEFDALKSSFQSQIDTYNQNIDSKIDGAIAAYLAGIKTTNEPIEKWSIVMANSANKFRWTNMLIDSGTNTITNDTLITTERYYNRKEAKVYSDLRSHSTPDNPDARAGIIYQLGTTQANAKTEGQLLNRSFFYGCGTFVSELVGWDGVEYQYRKWNDMTLYYNHNAFSTFNQLSTGSGRLWELNRLANDNYELKTYNSKAYLSINVSIKGYSYKDFATGVYKADGWNNFNAYYCTAGGVNDTTTTFETTTGLGYLALGKGTGFNVTSKTTMPTSSPYDSTGSWYNCQEQLSWTKINDGFDYSFLYWGANCTQGLYAITDAVGPNWTSATERTGYSTTDTYHTYIRPYYPYTGPKNEDVKVSRFKYKFYEPTITPLAGSLNTLENQYVSAQASDVIFHGNGAQCFENMSDDVKVKVKNIKLKLYNDDNSTLTSGTVKLMISKNKFVNGTYADASDKVFEKDYAVNSTGIATIETDEFDTESKGQIYWMNLYETSSAGKLIKLESIEPKLVK